MTRRAYTLLLVLLLAAGGLWLALRYVKGAVISDIAYGSDARQKLDIYHGADCPPEGCTVLLAVHGGGWSTGSKRALYDTGIAATLVRKGLIVVAPNHRLAPRFRHPAQVEDIASAFAWTYHNIAAYGGNPQRIYLLGHSSGAHLVSLLATNTYYLQVHGLQPAEVIRGVVSLDTASLDLERRIRVWGMDDEMRTNTFVPGSERGASPYWNVRDGGRYPPFLLIAASDSRESLRQAGAMSARLVQSGAKAQSLVLPHDGARDSHVQIFEDLASSRSAVLEAVLGFVQAN